MARKLHGYSIDLPDAPETVEHDRKHVIADGRANDFPSCVERRRPSQSLRPLELERFNELLDGRSRRERRAEDRVVVVTHAGESRAYVKIASGKCPMSRRVA